MTKPRADCDPCKFAEWLELTLLKKQLKIKELAEITGINKGTISTYISKQKLPTQEQFERICKGLKITPTKALKEIAATVCKKYV